MAKYPKEKEQKELQEDNKVHESKSPEQILKELVDAYAKDKTLKRPVPGIGQFEQGKFRRKTQPYQGDKPEEAKKNEQIQKNIGMPLMTSEKPEDKKYPKKLGSKNVEAHMKRLKESPSKYPGGKKQAIAIGLSQARAGEKEPMPKEEMEKGLSQKGQRRDMAVRREHEKGVHKTPFMAGMDEGFSDAGLKAAGKFNTAAKEAHQQKLKELKAMANPSLKNEMEKSGLEKNKLGGSAWFYHKNVKATPAGGKLILDGGHGRMYVHPSDVKDHVESGRAEDLSHDQVKKIIDSHLESKMVKPFSDHEKSEMEKAGEMPKGAAAPKQPKAPLAPVMPSKKPAAAAQKQAQASAQGKQMVPKMPKPTMPKKQAAPPMATKSEEMEKGKADKLFAGQLKQRGASPKDIASIIHLRRKARKEAKMPAQAAKPLIAEKLAASEEKITKNQFLVTESELSSKCTDCNQPQFTLTKNEHRFTPCICFTSENQGKEPFVKLIKNESGMKLLFNSKADPDSVKSFLLTLKLGLLAKKISK